jgi:hypothetical protein
MELGPTGLPTWIQARRGRHSACRGDEVPRSPSHLGSEGPEGRHHKVHRLAAVATKQPPPSGDGSYPCLAYQTRVRSTLACGGTFMVILVVSMDSE